MLASDSAVAPSRDSGTRKSGRSISPKTAWDSDVREYAPVGWDTYNQKELSRTAIAFNYRHCVAAQPPGWVPLAVSPIQNRNRQPRGTEMGRQITVVLYVVAMAAVIVGVDFVFFRNRFWERLTVNIGIVLVFTAFYLRFLR
jgi:hypothetical protein